MAELKPITIKDALQTDVKRFHATRADLKSKPGQMFNLLLETFEQTADKSKNNLTLQEENLRLSIENQSLQKKVNQFPETENNYKKSHFEIVEQLQQQHKEALEELQAKNKSLTDSIEALKKESVRLQGHAFICELELPVAREARKYRIKLTEQKKVSGNAETYPSELCNLAIKNYLNNKFDTSL